MPAMKYRPPISPFTDEELKRATAHHEAGHALLTIVSRFFQLGEPGMKLAPTVDATAQSSTRPRVRGMPTEKAMALEHVEIALAGRAAEMLFEEISERAGRRIFLHADSPADDFNYAGGALRYWSAEDQFDALMASAYGTVKANQAEWEELAEFARQRIGVVAEIPKAELESLPAVQRLLAKKRPL